VNVVAYCVYWWDKQASVEGARRVRESTLLWLVFAGASLGAFTAQQMLRHKTRKEQVRGILIAIGALPVDIAAVWIAAPDFVWKRCCDRPHRCEQSDTPWILKYTYFLNGITPLLFNRSRQAPWSPSKWAYRFQETSAVV
jgi:uncharacterized membrane protein YsdA (DUF1294 family)